MFMENILLGSDNGFKDLWLGMSVAVKDRIHFSNSPVAMTTPDDSAVLNDDGSFPIEISTEILLSEIAHHVEELFAANKYPYLLYHNLDHTRLVVQHAREIAKHYLLDIRLVFIVLAASWFHDTGHLLGNTEEHEETSVRIMKEYLTTKSVDEKTMNEISLCIRATKMPPVPSTLLEQIICDADTFHTGTNDFPHLNNLVWQEMEQRLNKPVSDKVRRSLLFLKNHRFFTSYCQQLLSTGKDRNILQLKTLLEE
jgi:predicted metal-dependent HD superfamily phosphohydrolase